MQSAINRGWQCFESAPAFFVGGSNGQAETRQKGLQVSEPSENALDDMWEQFFMAITHSDAIPRDASAIKTARNSALDGLRAAKHIEDTTERDARRAKRRRPDSYPFPDYR